MKLGSFTCPTATATITAFYQLGQPPPTSPNKAVTKLQESTSWVGMLDHQLPSYSNISPSLFVCYICAGVDNKLKQNMEKKKLWACYGIVLILALANLVAEGWAQDTSCLNQLAPCLNYLNGTEDPPDSCCDPLKSVIKSDPKCLCSLVSNKGSSEAQQAGIDASEAQQLPGRCGQHVNPVACIASIYASHSFSKSTALCVSCLV